MNKWKVGLVTEEYIFLILPSESDWNSNVKMYRYDDKITPVSENYFAYEEFMNQVKLAYTNKINVVYIDTDVECFAKEQAKAGEYEED